MKYRLRIVAAGHGNSVEITEGKYSEIVASVGRIAIAATIEERFDLVLESYWEYEHELLGLALRHGLSRGIDDQESLREIQRINLRAISLLASGRMYIDQVKHLGSSYLGAKLKEEVEALLSKEYEAHLYYRIAEALRNHVLHRGSPFHLTISHLGWENRSDPTKRLLFQEMPWILTKDLEEAGEFKARVLNELKEANKDKISLTGVFRRYLESLGTVTEEIRRIIAEQACRDYQILDDALHICRTELGGVVGLAATKDDENGREVQRHYVTSRLRARRDNLISRNHSFGKFSRRYVAAEYPEMEVT